MKRYKIWRKVLIFWTSFVGLTALYGSVLMFIDPTGKRTLMDGLIPGMQVLPFSDILFQNLIFPGISLLIVNGLSNITACILLIQNRKLGINLGITVGLTLMLWILIQFIIYPTNVLSISYFFIGVLQLLSGVICKIGYYQMNFKFNINDYKNICSNSRKLVVYFSRMGYTKKIAYEEANNTGAIIYEVKAKEKIDGNLGFWWCGRFGMHKWSMGIEDISIDVTQFDEITICSPIGVFSVCAPIREFCILNNGKIKKVNYILVHFMKAKFKKVVKELDDILDVKHHICKSYSSHYGKIKEIKM